jgi:hypothetical protein
MGISPLSSYSVKRFQRCHWHCWNNFCSVIDTAETISAVSLTPLKRFQWNDFSGFIDTAETISAVSIIPLKLMWHRWNIKQTLQVLFLLLKGKSIKNIPILYKYFKQKKVGGCLDLIFSFSGVTDITEGGGGGSGSDPNQDCIKMLHPDRDPYWSQSGSTTLLDPGPKQCYL